MKCLKLIFCLLYFCCSLAEAKEVQVDAQKEVDEITGRLVASYLEAKVDEDIIAVMRVRYVRMEVFRTWIM